MSISDSESDGIESELVLVSQYLYFIHIREKGIKNELELWCKLQKSYRFMLPISIAIPVLYIYRPDLCIPQWCD